VRKMTTGRRLAYWFAKPVLSAIIRFIWFSCRVQAVQGDEHVRPFLQQGQAVIPCYWHQQILFCFYYMVQLVRRGLGVGVLISPSVDGELPARLVQSWGVGVVRGSATRTGAAAIRDLYRLVTQDKVSPIHTPDGPTGPVFHFKAGVVLLSQITGAPILPIAFAADRYWKLSSWDQFLIPKPFARVQIVVGEPVYVAKRSSKEELEEARLLAQTRLQALVKQAEASLES